MKIKISPKAIQLQTDDKVTISINNKVDLFILISTVLLILIGILAIYSSTSTYSIYQLNYKKQIFFMFFGIGIGVIVYFLPMKYFSLFAFPLYFLSLFSLIFILIIGKTISGSQSWIGSGIFGIQPSEFAKLATILALSKFMSDPSYDVNKPNNFIKTFFIMFVPFVLILLQPDMGTALVFLTVFITVIFWDGISIFFIFALISPIIVGLSSIFGVVSVIVCLLLVIGILIYFKRDLFISLGVMVLNLSSLFLVDIFIKALSAHQVQRIETFIDPMKDPLKSGYNVLQSIVAIGSGGLFGKGFLEGSQTQLKFIPEQWTDFIFCVIGEEFGFVGSVGVLILFYTMIYRMIKLANYSKSRFRSNFIIMAVAIILTHVMINIGMAIGIMPVIGIPLPLVSYGGSSLITNILIIAIVLNFYKNRISFS